LKKGDELAGVENSSNKGRLARNKPSLKRPIYVFLICLAGWTLAQTDLGFFGFVVPKIMGAFRITPATLGNFIAIMFVFGAIAEYLWGAAADRFGRKPVFQWTVLLYSIFTFLRGIATNFGIFGVFSTLANASAQGEAPLTNVIMTEEAPARWRGVFVGLLQIGLPLGWLIGSIITVPVVAAWGWRAVFFIGIIPALFLLVLRFWFPETKRYTETRKSGVTRPSAGGRIKLLLSPKYRRQALSVFFFTLFWDGAVAGPLFFLPTYVETVKHFSFAEGTMLVGLAYGVGPSAT
jgi:MFS family permease